KYRKCCCFFFSSRRRHTRSYGDWSSDVCLPICLGVPALSLPVVSNQSNSVYGVTALVLSYSAYVSEVYRAGLNSVHQSQVAAARSEERRVGKEWRARWAREGVTTVACGSGRRGR